MIRECYVEGQAALVYETGAVVATILPALGGKIISLVERATGREVLWRQPGRPLRRPAYGDRYDRYDISGWDECFPSIGACPYPEAPWEGRPIPDHGELWAVPWRAESAGDELALSAEGVQFPYVFERRFRPIPDGLRVLYSVINTGASPLRYLWSMHPFLAVTPTTRILLPAGAWVQVEISKHARLGEPGKRHVWPRASDAAGHAIDLDLIGPPAQGWLEKLYAHDLVARWVAAIDEPTGDYIAFTFDQQLPPVVGMAINRGGWPFDDAPVCNLILEPCSGWPDRLDEALDHGACSVPPAGAQARWRVDLHVGRGQERLRAAIGGGSAV